MADAVNSALHLRDPKDRGKQDRSELNYSAHQNL